MILKKSHFISLQVRFQQNQYLRSRRLLSSLSILCLLSCSRFTHNWLIFHQKQRTFQIRVIFIYSKNLSKDNNFFFQRKNKRSCRKSSHSPETFLIVRQIWTSGATVWSPPPPTRLKTPSTMLILPTARNIILALVSKLEISR